MSFVISGRAIGEAGPPYIIAEIGVNHDGSIDRAKQLVDVAADAGADAVKFQYFRADDLVSAAGMLARYQADAGATSAQDLLSPLELSEDDLSDLVAYAQRIDLHAIVTVFNVGLVERADRLPWDAYKTASPDIIHRPLLDALVRTGRPLIVSTGAATMDEVQRASTWLGDHPHAFLQCVSSYPTPDEAASLGGLIAMRRPVDAGGVGDRALGYSDHTTAVDTGALAVACGARILEKHITYDRSAAGPDHAASLDPQQLAEYVRLARRARQMLGLPSEPLAKCVADIERDVRDVARQSLTTTRAIAAGESVQPGDITFKRPGTGLAPYAIDDIIGRTLARSIDADTPISAEDLA